jgi:predicted dehydrogenase
MNKPILWGIIGLGKIAEKFASDLLTIPNAKLHAVASSSSLEKAKKFAEKYQVSHYFDSYEAIFQAKLDVIYIATPHTLHAENTILCLTNKVAVLCEKPFAMNLQQVQKMVDLAQKNEVFLMEALWTRFIPAIRKTIQLIEDGRIGKIKSIQADFGFLAPFQPEKRTLNPELGGGALLDIGIYPAYLSLLLLGYPSEVQAASIIGKTGVDETTSFIFKYGNEATAVLNCSFATRTPTEAYIFGEKGYIKIHSRFIEAKAITLYEEEKEPETFTFERNTWGYNFEAEEVMKCLKDNKKQSDLMPHSMSIQLIKILDEIRQKTGIYYENIDNQTVMKFSEFLN